MSNPAALDALARIVGDALAPLANRLQGDQAEMTMAQLGLRLPLSAGGVTQGLQASVTACSQLPAAVTALIDAASGGDDGKLVAAIVNLGELIVRAGTAFAQLGTALDAVIQGDGSLNAAQKTRLRGVVEKLPDRLLHLALISYVEEKQPAVKGALELAGLFDDTVIEADPTDPSLSAHHLKQVRFDRIAPLFSNPAQHLKTLYGFGNPGFDGLELFRRIKQMVDRPDAEALIIEAPGLPAVLEAWWFRMEVVPGATPALRIRLRVPAQKNIDINEHLAGPWFGTVTSSARFEGGIELLLHPSQGLQIEPHAATVSIDMALGVKAENADKSPMILFGQVGGSRVELQRFALRLPLKLIAASGAASPFISLGAALELKQGKVVIDGSKADGFLATLIGGLKVESAFDLSASYDTADGLRFNGSATIEIAIPTHVSLGPVEIQEIYLISGFKDGGIPVEFSVDLGANLGPLQASISRFGASAGLTFPAGGGNAGVAQVDIVFKPPSGVGLVVDAAVVKGGGYLYFDFDREEYAGVLELSIANIVTVKAIGLITTKMPDGSKGFSLLIIITAEFGTGIQLGFGFTLIGLGGLLGLNRTMNLPPLMEGVRTGAINSIMFPDNPVANAPRIISDLRLIFPPCEGKFLIGPMAKLGWGTPTLVSVSLGVIIEIPGNIAILGVLKVALPAEEAPLIIIQVNFVGAIEFDKKRLYFFATMFESRVLYLTIEGDMGLLVAWGDDANFVVSVGGFHPRFNPPPLPFPSPRRIAIDILNTPVYRIRSEGYFAVTSNTVQFGSNTELMIDVGVAQVQGHINYDALFQFSPFYFIIDISAGVSFKVFGVGLFSISLQFVLEGPTPWRAHGSGSISFLFFDVSADFDVTWGDSQDTTLPPISVMPLLKAELEKQQNWIAELPGGNNLLVSLRKLSETESSQVLHPLGTLRVSQRAAPLDIRIDKVGSQKPADANQFKLVPTGDLVKVSDADEQFAKAQFITMSDADKLSQRAFDPLHGGVKLASGAQTLGSAKLAKRKVRYEQIIIDNNFKRFRRRFKFFSFGFFTHFLKGSAISKSALSKNYRSQLDPFSEKLQVKDGGFTVALAENNRAYSTQAIYFSSETLAQQYIQKQVSLCPELHETLHVIPQHEVTAEA